MYVVILLLSIGGQNRHILLLLDERNGLKGRTIRFIVGLWELEMTEAISLCPVEEGHLCSEEDRVGPKEGDWLFLSCPHKTTMGMERNPYMHSHCNVQNRPRGFKKGGLASSTC